jgi:urease alpha subunit
VELYNHPNPGTINCIGYFGEPPYVLGVDDRIGSIEPGKFADVIAVSGNPTTNVSELEHVKFVMKGGLVVRDAISQPAGLASAAK